MLLSNEKKRKELRVVCHGSCSAEHLRCSAEHLRCFGMGRIYLRPLQKNIALRTDLRVKQEFQECLVCGGSFAISEMRRHMNTCVVCQPFIFSYIF